MVTKTRAAIIVEYGKPLAVDEIVLKDPGDSEVLVKFIASGICHSQLHAINSTKVKIPSLLGHEGTGLVVKTGKNVSHIKEGDHCIITWVPRNISIDSPMLEQTRYEFRGETHHAGVYTWAESALVNEQLVIPLKKEVPSVATAIIGCATVTGVGAVMGSAKVKRGSSVVIIGVGGVGINIIAGAKIAKADPIIAVDLTDDKLSFAEQFGATHTINAAKVDPVEVIHRITSGGADFAFDAIGGPITIPQVLASVRSGRVGAKRGGTAVVVGIPTEPVLLPSEAFPGGEKHLIGSVGGSSQPDRDYPKYIDWFRKGELPLDKMITKIYSGLDDINEGVRALEKGEIQGRSIIVY